MRYGPGALTTEGQVWGGSSARVGPAVDDYLDLADGQGAVALHSGLDGDRAAVPWGARLELLDVAVDELDWAAALPRQPVRNRLRPDAVLAAEITANLASAHHDSLWRQVE
jgi:hypothetical protein